MADVNDATPDGPTVADFGEDHLLARIIPLLPTGESTLIGPGDDAAMITAPDGRFVVSTDVLVEGVHFRSQWSSGLEVGRRAAAQNLADIAAMGAQPTSLVVALVIPAQLPVSWVEDLARGLAEVVDRAGAGVVGGDLSGGDQLVVSVTVHGDLAGRPPVLRSGACAGDVLALAGTAGYSAAGLALLSADGGRAAGGSRRKYPEFDQMVEIYLTPDPPLAAGPAAACAGATAMLDVSDGLLRDAGRIAHASGVRIDLDDPVHVLADDLAALTPLARELGVDPLDWVLFGGEDHSLLASFPADAVLPPQFRPVGRVRSAESSSTSDRGGCVETGVAGVAVAGRSVARPGAGWDHFSGQPRR